VILSVNVDEEYQNGYVKSAFMCPNKYTSKFPKFYNKMCIVLILRFVTVAQETVIE